MARKVDFDPFKIHFTRNQSEEGGGAWRMARKRVKWIYPNLWHLLENCILHKTELPIDKGVPQSEQKFRFLLGKINLRDLNVVT